MNHGDEAERTETRLRPWSKPGFDRVPLTDALSGGPYVAGLDGAFYS